MTTQINPASLAEKTLELLWMRVRQRGDMPGFSEVVTAIVGAMHCDDDREFNMTKTVLSDPTLTQRVLRLANSAMYSAFGQGINTVSKAVIVLGTETIGHLALGLKLIDGLVAASTDTSNTRNEMDKAVMAGQIARQVASSSPQRDTEEAVVCSILHSLGRLMVSFYLPEQWAQVQDLIAQKNIPENEATKEILGLALDEIGRAIGKRWGLPSGLVESLKDMPPRIAPGISDEPLSHSDWLSAVSTMSTHCAGMLCADSTVVVADLASIAENYADMLGLDTEFVLQAIEKAQKVAANEVLLENEETATSDEKEQLPLPIGKPADSIQILKRGVGDMEGVATSSTNAGQLMAVALETVYQGLGLSRAIAFLRNHDEGKYIARMSFGEGAEELLPRLRFNDAYQPDVFHASLANDKMIFVADAQAPGFINKLPRWWRDELGTARSFMILPLMLNFHPVGFIYGDWSAASPTAEIVPNEVVLLDELRALMLKAIERRCYSEPSWARAMR